MCINFLRKYFDQQQHRPVAQRKKSANENLLGTKFTGITMALMVLAGASVAEAKGWSIPDFPSHVTELTDEQRRHLSEIASYLADQRSDNSEIVCMLVVGHAATWRNIPDSEYDFRALNRAHNAAAYLASAMETRGLTTEFLEEELLDAEIGCEPGVSDFTFYVGGRGDDEPVVSNLVSRSDAEARRNRSLNRRVELELVRYVQPKGQCVPEKAVVHALSRMKPTGTDANRRVRVKKLRDLLIEHYGCNLTLDDYYHTTEIGGAHLLEKFERKCNGKTKRSLAICLNSRHDDILFMVNHMMGELLSLRSVLGVTPASIRKTEECAVGRYFLSKAANERSVYNAFRPLIARGFSVCASS